MNFSDLKDWSAGDPILAEQLNAMRKGVERAGGGLGNAPPPVPTGLLIAKITGASTTLGDVETYPWEEVYWDVGTSAYITRPGGITSVRYGECRERNGLDKIDIDTIVLLHQETDSDGDVFFGISSSTSGGIQSIRYDTATHYLQYTFSTDPGSGDWINAHLFIAKEVVVGGSCVDGEVVLTTDTVYTPE